ncbi:sensor histidine kinase [Streptomyces litchfieldiae]|uniref:Histidine kinase n=1 Tax=Streptomyces litchfieldiae TaxID=3075543 RepID=A0ABU2MTR3_9ACTN|nr:histidine kinase [Streptomyces sp. DSM 44938]MDT0345035.1 histidine kinase [Streptomyces sp. DSM 44938]
MGATALTGAAEGVLAMRAFGWLETFRRSSQRTRVHQYCRYTLYGLSVMEAGLIAAILVAVADESELWALAAVAVLSLCRPVLGLLLTRAALPHYLGDERRPVRLLAAFCAVTLAGIGMTTAAVAAGALPNGAVSLVIYLGAYFAGPVLLALPLARGSGLAAVPAVASAAAGFALPLPGGVQVWAAVATTLTAAVLGGAYRATGWTMRVVDRLDAARETEARLAVAEERLRFGRDLHDVLGRNLSVIALKSELAAQLAQRGSAAAVDQMTEVQRIARESQREIREVVRGYRKADLHGELAGARGVLEAAGIACGIEDAVGGLPARVQSALGWVVREGTTNVLRHAEAARCTVRLRRTASGEAVLEMENDGVRADAAPGGDGTGLAGLRERLAALGGSLSAGPASGGTFRLTARVPAEGVS